MFILRRDPRSRRIANIYLVASVSGMLACAVRITTACLPPLQTPLGAMLVWLFACTCGVVFALRGGPLLANQDQMADPGPILNR